MCLLNEDIFTSFYTRFQNPWESSGDYYLVGLWGVLSLRNKRKVEGDLGSSNRALVPEPQNACLLIGVHGHFLSTLQPHPSPTPNQPEFGGGHFIMGESCVTNKKGLYIETHGTDKLMFVQTGCHYTSTRKYGIGCCSPSHWSWSVVTHQRIATTHHSYWIVKKIIHSRLTDSRWNSTTLCRPTSSICTEENVTSSHSGTVRSIHYRCISQIWSKTFC